MELFKCYDFENPPEPAIPTECFRCKLPVSFEGTKKDVIDRGLFRIGELGGHIQCFSEWLRELSRNLYGSKN